MDSSSVSELYEKISKQLTLRGAFRARAGWTQRQVKLGKLHAAWLPMLQTMEDIMEEFFPGQWDIHTVVSTDYMDRVLRGPQHKVTRRTMFQPVVYFPDIILKNSKRMKHRIVDLFLKFNVEHMPQYGDDVFNFGAMYGMRATLSDLEYAANYNHSHFQGHAKEFRFSHCCTGSGEINTLFALLNAKFDEDTFRLLMLQLKTYASWESLEGHPYKRIENIIPKEKGVTSRLTTSDVRDYGEEILAHMRTSNIRLDWNLVNGIPKVVNNSKLDTALKFLGNDLNAYDEQIIGLIMVVDESGRLEHYQPRLPENSPRKKPRKVKGFIPFRGKEFPFTVLPPEDPLVAKQQKVYTQFFINNSIKQYVIGKLEARAAKLADPVRNGVLRHLKGEAGITPALHAESQIPVW